MTSSKTVLFFPLNSAGHINSSLGLADKLKEHYGYRTVFLLLGPGTGTGIQDHGHELIELEEVDVLKDYEFLIDDPEDLDESEQEKMGRTKKKFPGSLKWPQIIRRAKKFIKMPPLDSFEKAVELFEERMFGELVNNHDNYTKAIDSINPDLVVIDAYYIPPCVVNLKHIPWIRLFSANPLQIVKIKDDVIAPPGNMGFKLLNKAEREKLRTESPQVWTDMVEEWREAWDRIMAAVSKVSTDQDKFFVEHGCPPLSVGQQAHESPHLNLYMFPKEIDYDKDDDLFQYSPRWFRCDSLMRKPISALNQTEYDTWVRKLNEAMKGKDSMIYFSLGSLASADAKLVMRYVDILRHDQKRLYVVSKGPNGDQFQLDSSNMIGGNYLPQTFFLERADLAIVHGGNNSLTECLMYGVPMIILPVFADQFDNAQRIEDLELGKRLDVFNCTKQELLQAIDQVLEDKSLIDKIKNIGSEMRKRDDLTRVASVVSKLIEEKNLNQEFIDSCRT